MNFLLLLSGPGPAPPMPEGMRDTWPLVATMYLFGVTLVLVAAFSVLLRYSERFREFWARHVCDFMEEHAIRGDEPKGEM